MKSKKLALGIAAVVSAVALTAFAVDKKWSCYCSNRDFSKTYNSYEAADKAKTQHEKDKPGHVVLVSQD
jgi:hypothetical protein